MNWHHIIKWEPKRLVEPSVDKELPYMNGLQRSAESFRYSILSTEFWISPDGQVREFLRHNTRLVVLLFIPALIIIPIISFALSHIAGWTVALTTISTHLIFILVLLLVSLLLLAFIKSIFR